MAYVRNPVFLGVGTLDHVDRDAGLTKQVDFDIRFKNAFRSMARMPPQALVKFMREVSDAVSALPYEKRQQVLTMAKVAEKNLDPRMVPGLGQAAAAATAANAVHWTTQVANIAGVVASLATVGFGVANFIEQRKASKEEQARQDRQQAMAEAQMAQDLKERQERLEAAKAQTAALQEKQKLEASGYTVAPDGSIVPKKNPAATVGAVAAAAVGAFFMTK